MRLHYHPVSPFSRKAWIAVKHRGDDVELHQLNPRAGDLRSPAYLAMSPFGKMPALETDDGPIFESTSIIEWLEAKGPRVLLPRGTELVARRWDRIGDHYLITPASVLWWEPGTGAAGEAVKTAATALDLLTKHLGGQDFVAGRHFTLGDVSAAVGVDLLQRLEQPIPEALTPWKTRVYEIPAMAEIIGEVGPMMDGFLAARRASDPA